MMGRDIQLFKKRKGKKKTCIKKQEEIIEGRGRRNMGKKMYERTMILLEILTSARGLLQSR
uniref:Uncharacterized protein n=1 Tax=Nelumbo nucifera TaxID=4432 RepID=A0A822YLX8_NELNU|nr:TPA_asm: hypothetical protein HUJ06_005814 [Nelumbo nucifera]